MDGKHIVNCPFFTQDTIFEHATNKSSVSTAMATNNSGVVKPADETAANNQRSVTNTTTPQDRNKETSKSV